MENFTKERFNEYFISEMSKRFNIMTCHVVAEAVSTELMSGRSDTAVRIIEGMKRIEMKGSQYVSWRVLPALQATFFSLTGNIGIRPSLMIWLSSEEQEKLKNIVGNRSAFGYVEDVLAMLSTGQSMPDIFSYLDAREELECQEWLSFDLPRTQLYSIGKLLAMKVAKQQASL